jgi:hypothetical protein
VFALQVRCGAARERRANRTAVLACCSESRCHRAFTRSCRSGTETKPPLRALQLEDGIEVAEVVEEPARRWPGGLVVRGGWRELGTIDRETGSFAPGRTSGDERVLQLVRLSPYGRRADRREGGT